MTSSPADHTEREWIDVVIEFKQKPNKQRSDLKMCRKLALILSLTALGTFREANAQTKKSFDGFKLVDKAGNISKPVDFRDLYQMIGAYAVLDPKGNQLHYTWASPGAAEYYRQNGKFADGTVLVKQVFGTDHAQLSTGNANWAADTKVWFVLIKDAKGR